MRFSLKRIIENDSMVKFITSLLALFATLLVATSLQAAPTLTITSGDEKLVLDRSELETFPQTQIVTTSPYFEGSAEFTGPSLSRVLETFDLSGDIRIVLRALNDYRVDGNLRELLAMDPIVATRMDSQPMSVRDRGPFWLMLPLSDRPELDEQEFHRFMIWQLEAIILD
ncbi:MAG TPA: hypothetical protein DC045_12795 [Marinobacter adhaerens]|uniref:Oxidoreductase molybdopterin-binding domain-containing protein n=1 Tax=Marinobacter adhaerens TaxID=1033846 RepID=A0A352IUM7_9GAMM|nr:hypothetical protein [Marinobacter adhaerens]